MKTGRKQGQTPKPYCRPDEHTWVQVVDGFGYHEDRDTKVCIKCECYSSVVKNWSPVTREQETHPDTMIGKGSR